MPHEKWLEFLSEGLPLILDNAKKYWEASRKLKDNPREGSVLQGFAEEEAAKILILMDAVRCPRSLISSKMGNIASWFYNHLARLIYSEAVRWKPMNVTQLREYVEEYRKSHSLEGYVGEYILPNWSVYERESLLYVDITCVDIDGTLAWDTPNYDTAIDYLLVSPALRVAEAMFSLGIFKTHGLKATSEVWGQTEFKNSESIAEAEVLLQLLLERLIEEGLPSAAATQEHVDRLYGDWQLPMYNFDFTQISVPVERLKEEQDHMLQVEMWDFYGLP